MYSYNMKSNLWNCPNTSTDAVLGYPSYVPYTARRSSSSHIFIMSYAVGVQTCQVRPSLPHVCATTPSFPKVATCKA